MAPFSESSKVQSWADDERISGEDLFMNELLKEPE